MNFSNSRNFISKTKFERLLTDAILSIDKDQINKICGSKITGRQRKTIINPGCFIRTNHPALFEKIFKKWIETGEINIENYR